MAAPRCAACACASVVAESKVTASAIAAIRTKTSAVSRRDFAGGSNESAAFLMASGLYPLVARIH